MRKGIWLVPTLVFTVALLHAQTRYTVEDLGTIGGAFTSCVHGLNSKTQIAGVSSLSGDEVFDVFLWQKGMITDLGTLGMTSSCVGTMAMNAKTEIVGQYSLPDGAIRAFLWRDGGFIDLGTLGGSKAFAEGIDNVSRIVGGSFLINDTRVRSFLWRNGTMRNLSVNSGNLNSVAHGINDAGQIVGETEDTKLITRGFREFNAFLWHNGTTRLLGNLGGELTAAFALNSLGHVVGLSETNILEPNTGWFLSHAYIWRKGMMTDLGTLPGDNASHANQVNNKDQVVGTSGRGINMGGFTGMTLNNIVGISPDCSAFQFQLQGDPCFDWANAHGFLWQHGKMYDLNDLIPANSGWQLVTGDAINDKGEIVAGGFKDGDIGVFRSCLLRPQK